MSPTHPYFEEDVAEVLTEAERVEAARQQLLLRSHDIRLGIDPNPTATIRALSQAAEILLDSDVPPWEVATTLSQTAANLYANPVESPAKQHLVRLAISAINAHHAEAPDDSHGLNDLEGQVHIEAIKHTTPDTPFLEALSESWTDHNRPLEKIIDETGQLIEEADKAIEAKKRAKEAAAAEAQAKLEAAKPKTGKFDPFAEDNDAA